MTVLKLARASLWNRRSTAALVICSVALSVALLLGVERLRVEARHSFANTLSGVDLIVGARSGPINLLLYSVFRMGDPTSNVSWASVEKLRTHPQVDWIVPLSLGDSHKGFPVLGTSAAYFEHYRYRQGESLRLASGGIFDDVFDAVLGAEVARKLGYQQGARLVLAHGTGAVSLTQHADKPFRVVGILERTGTPVDNTVHISLAGMEAIHADWRGGAPLPGYRLSAERVREMDLTPSSVTAVMVGLTSRRAVFQVQRQINTDRDEALMAILPGLTLQQLWDMMRVGEQALLAVSALVAVVALTVMLTALLTGLNERRREMALLRALGARPWQIFALVIGESLVLSLGGAVLGVLLLQGMAWAASDWISGQLGLTISLWPPTAHEAALLAALLAGGVLAGLWPAWRAYRNALVDGMTIRM
ncbi:lipoprotein release ABC transporter permease [Isoalcanivorax pacificus W11-5]|uniref:Lipoprotein release ABC transporter permease n=1 Tax=Isoalcanivorax pacificus W11-5 TaxID=391936 RepID=A0A0B4XMY0_9GAMM|nr:ABC transporter permease [Isoalcanivorax pacificus]AJD49754.1 lipoprotein release ABC transporter permease [Isoalcanivorax pacificus W11-5]